MCIRDRGNGLPLGIKLPGIAYTNVVPGGLTVHKTPLQGQPLGGSALEGKPVKSAGIPGKAATVDLKMLSLGTCFHILPGKYTSRELGPKGPSSLVRFTVPGGEIKIPRSKS